ncbi:hypothetical protein O181_087580 [Austropuccinia psidii MF-1]|uniref:Uncharacterized protein n=1 Tax=Austropuccinia psidii MF-1 TaxID=1389203 RepID=A0A9Q3P267_9BASI|nr:hypothetical protein [Austropuccinia psidii MF-1]
MRLRHCPHHSLHLRTPASSSPWLTILTLLQALNLCLRRCPHPPLRLLAPAQHASNAAYHPYARSALPTCLRGYLPSLGLWSTFPTCLPGCLPSLRLYSARPTCL